MDLPQIAPSTCVIQASAGTPCNLLDHGSWGCQIYHPSAEAEGGIPFGIQGAVNHVRCDAAAVTLLSQVGVGKVQGDAEAFET